MLHTITNKDIKLVVVDPNSVGDKDMKLDVVDLNSVGHKILEIWSTVHPALTFVFLGK